MNFIKKWFKQKQHGSAYDYSFTCLSGLAPLPLNQFQNKVILIVNTASKCGFTNQYQALEMLYERYKDRGLIVLGVPSNDFAKQEPGSNEDIATFCRTNYGVTFPMTQKEHISGEKAHPFYHWARKTLGFGSAPKWNFHKILIDKKGNLIDYFYSTTKPDAPVIVNSIEKLLAE